MIWVDREVLNLKKRNLPLEWVDDMKTPSGRVHVGALRGVVIHDMIYKALVEAGIKAKTTYVFNDFDQMDAIPSYLDKKWGKYSGMPLCRIPSPVKGFDSFAQYFAQEFIDVFTSINCKPEIIWSSKLYESGKMNDVIKEALDNAETIRGIYADIAKSQKDSSWLPFQVVCEKCGKMGTTESYKWDSEKVHYRCKPEMTTWANGCGHEGAVSPFNGTGKLHWKVDWPAHWKVMGVTVEGSGKDHMSEGGSYDMANAICKNVFHIDTPHAVPYEWFTIGGKKMSSSKGIGTSAKEVSEILPPSVFRFLIVRTPVGTHLDFNPQGDTIPDLFDDYDRCMDAYYRKLENNIPEGKQGDVLQNFARIIELSEVHPYPKKRFLLPRFRTIVNTLQTHGNIEKLFEHQKGEALNKEEVDILNERITYAKIYIKSYTGETQEEQEETLEYTEEQIAFLRLLTEKLEAVSSEEKEDLQNACFEALKESGLKPKVAFPAFYFALVGKTRGPKAGDLILNVGKSEAITKLKEITGKNPQ